MKLIMENWKRFLKEENFRYLSEEEYDALSAEEQLAYTKKFVRSDHPKEIPYKMTWRGYRDKRVETSFHKGAKHKFAKGSKEFKEKVLSAADRDKEKIRAQVPDWAQKVIGQDPSRKGQELGYALKDRWAEVVDPAFAKQFKWVHGFKTIKKMKIFLEGLIDPFDEISVMGYLDKIAGASWGTMGFLVTGTPTLIGGTDMSTDNMKSKGDRKVGAADLKYSLVPEHMLTSNEDWKNFKNYGKSIDEALLVDWEIQAIVLTKGKIPEGFEELVKAAAKKYPILDQNFQKVS